MFPECRPPLSRPELVRWRRNLILLALGAALFILAAAWLGRALPLRSPGRIALALLQGGACAALIVAIARPLKHFDELQLRIQLEALSLAFAGTAILGTTYGFLVHAGLPDIEWGTLLWPVMTVLWALGQMIANRRYRSEEGEP